MRRYIGHAAFAVALWRLYATSAPWADIQGVNLLQRTDLRLDSLLWGCAVAFLYTETRHKLAAIRPMACVAMVAVILLPYMARAASAWAPLLVIAAVLSPLVIPFILAATSLHPEWLASRFLELPAFAWIGRLSYSLYLWQELFLVQGFKSPSLPLNLALTLAAACASYYLIERPMIRLGRSMSTLGNHCTARHDLRAACTSVG